MHPSYNIDTTTEKLALNSPPLSGMAGSATLAALEADGLITNPDEHAIGFNPLDATDAFITQAVGTVLFDGEFVQQHRKMLKWEMFVQDTHRALTKAMLSHWEAFGEHPDKATIKDMVTKKGDAKGFAAGLELEAIADEYAPGLYKQNRIVEYLKTQHFRLWQLQSLDLKRKQPERYDLQDNLYANYREAITPEPTAAPFLDVMAEDFTAGESTTALIENFLLLGRTLLFGGKSKAGKSVIMHPVMCSLLFGDMFLGGKPSGPVPIIYLDFEATRDYFKDWFNKFRKGRDPAIVSKYLHYAGNSPHPSDAGALPEYLSTEYLDKRIAAFDEPGVIIVDTFRGAYIAAPELEEGFENNTVVVGKLLRHLTKWCRRTGWAVIMLHHFNKQGKVSGSTDFSAACDTVCLFDRDLDNGSNECSFTMQGRFLTAPQKRLAIFHEHGELEYTGTGNDVDKKKRDAAKIERAEFIRKQARQFVAVVADNCNGEFLQRDHIIGGVVADTCCFDSEYDCVIPKTVAARLLKIMADHDVIETATGTKNKKTYRATIQSQLELEKRWDAVELSLF